MAFENFESKRDSSDLAKQCVGLLQSIKALHGNKPLPLPPYLNHLQTRINKLMQEIKSDPDLEKLNKKLGRLKKDFLRVIIKIEIISEEHAKQEMEKGLDDFLAEIKRLDINNPSAIEDFYIRFASMVQAVSYFGKVKDGTRVLVDFLKDKDLNLFYKFVEIDIKYKVLETCWFDSNAKECWFDSNAIMTSLCRTIADSLFKEQLEKINEALRRDPLNAELQSIKKYVRLMSGVLPFQEQIEINDILNRVNERVSIEGELKGEASNLKDLAEKIEKTYHRELDNYNTNWKKLKSFVDANKTNHQLNNLLELVQAIIGDPPKELPLYILHDANGILNEAIEILSVDQESASENLEALALTKKFIYIIYEDLKLLALELSKDKKTSGLSIKCTNIARLVDIVLHSSEQLSLEELTGLGTVLMNAINILNQTDLKTNSNEYERRLDYLEKEAFYINFKLKELQEKLGFRAEEKEAPARKLYDQAAEILKVAQAVAGDHPGAMTYGLKKLFEVIKAVNDILTDENKKRSAESAQQLKVYKNDIININYNKLDRWLQVKDDALASEIKARRDYLKKQKNPNDWRRPLLNIPNAWQRVVQKIQVIADQIKAIVGDHSEQFGFEDLKKLNDQLKEVNEILNLTNTESAPERNDLERLNRLQEELKIKLLNLYYQNLHLLEVALSDDNAFQGNDEKKLLVQGRAVLKQVKKIAGEHPDQLSFSELKDLNDVVRCVHSSVQDRYDSEKSTNHTRELAQLSERVSGIGKSSKWRYLGYGLLALACVIGLLFAIPSGGSSLVLTALGSIGLIGSGLTFGFTCLLNVMCISGVAGGLLAISGREKGLAKSMHFFKDALKEMNEMEPSPFEVVVEAEAPHNNSILVDWNRLSEAKVTIDGIPFQELVNNDRGSEAKAKLPKDIFKDEKELEAFIKKHLLKNISQELQEQAIGYLMEHLHQAHLLHPICGAALVYFNKKMAMDDKFSYLPANFLSEKAIEERVVEGARAPNLPSPQIRVINFTTTNNGFKVQEIVTQNEMLDMFAPETQRFLYPDRGKSYIYKAQATLDIDCSTCAGEEKHSSPTVTVESNTIAYGSQFIKDLEPKPAGLHL